MTQPSQPGRWALAATAVASLLVLAACGTSTSTSGQAQVASLPSTSVAPPTSGGPATTVSVGRPQERIDDTPQRHAALITAWDDCLLAHGATRSGAGVAGTSGQISSIPAAARTACADKEPVPPPELDPAKNPNYRSDWQADVACLRVHGVLVHLDSDPSAGPNGLSWTFDANAPQVANEPQIESTCQLTAFGGKR